MIPASCTCLATALLAWLRRAGCAPGTADGIISTGTWNAAEEYLRLAAAVFVSEEEMLDNEMLDDYRRWSRLLVMTQGSRGCTIFLGDEARQIPTFPGPVVDTTGAGDIFAAAFLVRLFQTGGNPSEAALFANNIASISISVAGLRAKMNRIRSHLSSS